MPLYGQSKLQFGIDGIEYLKEGPDVMTERFLTDQDLKKIRIMKLRKAVRQVDRKGFRSSSEEESGEEAEDDISDNQLSEDGEDDMEDFEDSVNEPVAES